LAAPKEIVDLVEKFERNYQEYKNSTYNEEQTRHEFINPFFKALGWDMYNEQGFSEAYKEVLYESSLKVGSTTKAPDYAFKIGEAMKFLVEAKKPSVNLKDNADPANQLRSYAWNAKLPVSILTDFDELAIYDCRYPPKKIDKADTALIRYLKYTDYVPCWDWIASKFSKTAIQQGYLDKFLKENKDKKGTKEVDAAFLEAISQWREDLARNIAVRNRELSVEELNTSVQATIDRIVFLRICEDRGIEKYGQIQEIASKENIYAELCNLFKHADDRYNSGLFHFKKEPGREYPDLLAMDLKIDDVILRDITSSLYPPSPYNFAIISPEILGQVYEQFLGKVIRLTEGHRAKVEEKPEVKKAGGIKYTPPYIVQNIVRKTLNPLLKGKTPLEVVLIKVLDPACGSGSFLLVAYKYLLDWHLDWYIKNLAPMLDKGYSVTSATIKALMPVSVEDDDDEKSQKIKTGTKARRIKARAKERASSASIPIYKTNDGVWHLTIAERKRILLNNIYGVDIDRQAVEVTKLSLLLKVLEGENQQTVSDLLKYSRERVLPDLDENIKCGNSLIGSDIMQTEAWSKMQKTEHDRINPFDWEIEFPEIMQAGGFHAIIGNPPYIRIQTMKEWAPDEVEYYKYQYTSANKGNYDIYVVFVEKGLSLLNENGKLGFILPHKFFQAQFGQGIRELLSKRKALSEIIHFGAEQVFEGVTTYTCLLFLQSQPSNSFRFVSIKSLDNPHQVLTAAYESKPDPNYEEAIFPQPESSEEWLFDASNNATVVEKIRQQKLTLGDITRKIFVGLQTSADKIYVLKALQWEENEILCYSKSLDKQVKIERGLIKPFLMGKDVHRYQSIIPENIVIFPYTVQNNKATLMSQDHISSKFPKGWQYLLENKLALAGREKGKMQGDRFYAYIYPKNLSEFEQQKIMTPEIALGSQLSFDPTGIFYHTTKVYSFVFKDAQKENILYFLGILNSKLLWVFLKTTGYALRGGYFTFKTEYLKPFPIRVIDFSNKLDVASHDHIVSLVDNMLSLNKLLSETRTGHEQKLLQRQIEATDRQIDALVYELYGLTEEEIEIVESA
jgi:type I restriction-modification system DNA methylase subunit